MALLLLLPSPFSAFLSVQRYLAKASGKGPQEGTGGEGLEPMEAGSRGGEGWARPREKKFDLGRLGREKAWVGSFLFGRSSRAKEGER